MTDWNLEYDRQQAALSDCTKLREAAVTYFAALDKARRVKASTGMMGLDGGALQGLYETEEALRRLVGAPKEGAL